MSSLAVSIVVNGDHYDLDVDTRWTLLYLLREKLRLTGSKEGCGTGDCGACSVIIDNKLVTSCLMLAIEANGSDIVTIEGVATEEELDPIQEEFIKSGAVQCGFCTPGMVMSAIGIVDDNPTPSHDEIRHELEGNICRCTGYHNIVLAIEAAAKEMRS